MSRTQADVVVVGAGVIGCALARELCGAGLRVVVVDRERPGAGASSAAAGILSPQAEADGPSPLLSLGLESRALFPRLVEELREETGIEVAYRTAGTLFIALDDEAEARIEARYVWQTAAGLPVERISGSRAATLEPALVHGTRIALRFPYDHQIDNEALNRALAAAVEHRGGIVLENAVVTEVLARNGRVEGVALASGSVVGPKVVICAGAWSGQIQLAGPSLPVVPVRGQMVALQAADLRIDRVIVTDRGYLVPRLDGRILVGSTMERCGFETSATAKGVGSLLALAQAVAPGLENAKISRIWAGLRPATEDGLPILGEAGSPWPSGLFFATGHFRNGILLAPITARLVADTIVSGTSPPSLETFGAARFGQGSGI